MSIAEEMEEFLVEDRRRSKYTAFGSLANPYPYVRRNESGEDENLRLSITLS